jgi:hypothetical protein
MKYLKIQNDGLLDIRLLSLMGGTTKANDKFKIGQWGSGLKYSMAWLLRNNLSFRVFIGSKEVSITTEKEVIRNEEFEIIYIDGEKTSVTTNMGGDAWIEWMIVRELWCNALDEGGNSISIEDTCFGCEDKTTFYIQLTQGFKLVMDNWDDYFIHDKKAIHSNGVRSIYHNKGDIKLFKQGVLIKQMKGNPSVFSYNINDAELNELREYNGAVSYEIYKCLRDAPVEVIKYFIENVQEDHFESSMDWRWSGSTLSSSWKEAIGNRMVSTSNQISILMAFNKSIDLSNVLILGKELCDIITRNFPELGVTKKAGRYEFFENENLHLRKRIMSMIYTLQRKGYYLPANTSIKIGSFDDKKIIASANPKDKEVFFSEMLNDKNDNYLASTIIEEFEHVKTGMPDESREFQQHFIDMYADLLLKQPNTSDHEQEVIHPNNLLLTDNGAFN